MPATHEESAPHASAEVVLPGAVPERPAAHAVHPIAPGAEENLPAAHSAQVAPSEAPMLNRNFPAAHLVQTVMPEVYW